MNWTIDDSRLVEVGRSNGYKIMCMTHQCHPETCNCYHYKLFSPSKEYLGECDSQWDAEEDIKEHVRLDELIVENERLKAALLEA